MAEIVAETERLIIRPWRQGDRGDYLASCNNDVVTAHLGGPASVEDVDASLARIAKSQDENGFCFWAVERKQDGAFLGYCGLKPTNLADSPVEGEIEIGWRLRADAWGQGYASEAATAVLDWAWANLGAGREDKGLGHVLLSGRLIALDWLRCFGWGVLRAGDAPPPDELVEVGSSGRSRGRAQGASKEFTHVAEAAEAECQGQPNDRGRGNR